MKPTHDERVISQCSGKECFITMRLAQQVARRRRRNEINGGAYKCCQCNYFHIGKMFSGKRPGRRRPLFELEDEAIA